MTEKPLKEHYEVDSDAGIMVRTFDYIADLEKYCTSIESYMLSKIDDCAAKDQRIKELELQLETETNNAVNRGSEIVVLKRAIERSYDWLKDPGVPIQAVITVLRKAKDKQS
jgi:hypothetical protein